VLNLRAVIGERSGRDVARLTGVDRTSVGAILAGTTWPDMATVIRLELALGSLWPRTESTSVS
jgi:transcriptional regulator with XRE-family HTH domain